MCFFSQETYTSRLLRPSERLMKHRYRDSNPEMENFFHLQKTSAYEDLHISCAWANNFLQRNVKAGTDEVLLCLDLHLFLLCWRVRPFEMLLSLIYYKCSHYESYKASIHRKVTALQKHTLLGIRTNGPRVRVMQDGGSLSKTRHNIIKFITILFKDVTVGRKPGGGCQFHILYGTRNIL
jgi:hypothetical protein